MSTKPIHLAWDVAAGPDHTVWGVSDGTRHVTLPPECGTILNMTPAARDTILVDCEFAVVTLDMAQSPPGIKVEMLPT